MAATASSRLQEPKPMLRGWLHLVCFFLAVPVGAWVVLEAAGTRARIGAVIYAIGLVALFGVSGFYHRGNWRPHVRLVWQSLDHTTIFVMIAGSYTPICLLVLDGWLATSVLVGVWAGAALGGVLAWRTNRRAVVVRSTLYIVLGWVAVATLPQMASRLGAGQLALILVGGVLFTGGAITLATRRPNPFPRVFGYHEVWHVLVVAAVICQLIAISSVIRSPVIGAS